ncbi:DnaJ-domain-containing protein [Aspergillus heteromorphus CBS 117.55]|uniref:DnaJ-domain-containing protein n=1 Tax=Aspergillus heteromorphus CBS 117.55 TaxID=1448321 RepID=A0A317VTP6_9EURO|nr:DnaJ-domain-containing protein [Aspergillus heteromorphus CBS 117.55]PWY76322.1 DnaJ-domain-containing protein [Aspergillus heteromorphus CBS 117.55]
MSSAPDIDPYAVLGVPKHALLPDIKSAHRKLVLKWHPDKIKDESLRSKAQDEFQKVQQAYELLSDDTRRAKYDAKVRLAELQREAKARGVNITTSSPYSATRASGSGQPREYRNGRIYEERTPADTSYFDDDVQFSEGSRSTSRKHDDFKKRYSKTEEKKKKSKADPISAAARAAAHAAKESRESRDTARTAHTDRDKFRTRERKREVFEKNAQSYYVKVKRPSTEKRSRESSSRKAKPESSRRRDPPRYEEEYSDEKHVKLHMDAKDYIQRSKGSAPIKEVDGRKQTSRSPPRNYGYESADPESSSSRHSGRTKRPSKESVRTSSSRNGSYETLETQPRSYEGKVPSMPTAATSPTVKVSPSLRPSLQPSRSTSASHPHVRSKGGFSRSELAGMVHEATSRTAKLRSDKLYDSGYSSPGTPEMVPGESSPKTTRYKVTEDPDAFPPDTSIPPPQTSPRHAYSPSRPDRPVSGRPMQKPPTRSNTYTYPAEHSLRYEAVPRPSVSRQSSSRPPLYAESRPKEKDYNKYAREIGPDHVSTPRDSYMRKPHYDSSYDIPHLSRRPSAYA